RVTVFTAGELSAAVNGNPLLEVADDPSRLLVAFLADTAARRRLEPLAGQDWAPEALAPGKRGAYPGGPAGIPAGRLPEAVGRVLGDGVTTRNWATVTKLHALIGDQG